MPDQINCKLCNTTSVPLAENIVGYQLGKPYTIYHCAACNTNFAVPNAVDNAIYDAIYRNGEKVPNYAYYHKYSRDVLTKKKPLQYLAQEGDAYWAIYNSIRQGLIQPSDTILEVGCGLGYLTYALRQTGYTATGVDISEQAIRKAQSIYGDYYVCADINELANDQSKRYDVILLTEVIEHISEPVVFLSSLKKLLKPTGRIILTTPNKSAFPSQAIWECDLPPVHLYWLSELSMQQIGNEIGMTTEFMDFSAYNWTHFDASKVRPQLMRGSPVLDENEHVIERPSSVVLPVVVHILNKYRFLKKMISFILMAPQSLGSNWKRRHFMCVVYRMKP